jgi:hypothetical protein
MPTTSSVAGREGARAGAAVATTSSLAGREGARAGTAATTTSSLAGRDGARTGTAGVTSSSAAGREGARATVIGRAPGTGAGFAASSSCWAGVEGARGRNAGGPPIVIEGDWTTLDGPCLASTLGESGVVAVTGDWAGLGAATRGGCGDVAGDVTGFAEIEVFTAGRGAAPIEGLPAPTGEVPVTGGFGACSGTTALAGLGVGLVAGALEATVCGPVAAPTPICVRAAAWPGPICVRAAAWPGITAGGFAAPAAVGWGAGFVAAEVERLGEPGEPALGVGTAGGTRGVSPPGVLVGGGLGGDAGFPPPA